MSNATWKIEISHLCNTSHLQGIPELINKYIRTGIFCNILPSRDNFLPWISDHLTNSNQAFTPCAAAQKRGWALLRAPSPEHWGKGSRNTRKPDMALTAPKQQRFLLNKVLNHMFKRTLMDVSMAQAPCWMRVWGEKVWKNVWCRVWTPVAHEGSSCLPALCHNCFRLHVNNPSKLF